MKNLIVWAYGKGNDDVQCIVMSIGCGINSEQIKNLEKFANNCDLLWKDGWIYEIVYEKYYEDVRVPFLLKRKIKRLFGKNHSLKIK